MNKTFYSGLKKLVMSKQSRDFRVLSVQSHVVSGYVGNKSACFPLQLLGFEVDSINSVHLSNHTGYPHIRGQLLNGEDLQEVYEGLKLNNLLNYTHVLTGYVGTPTFFTRMVEMIIEMKKMNPDLCFICDPVMGDNGKMYVPEDVLPLYRDHLIPKADIITPNQYETEWLTGISLKTEKDIIQAIDVFHEKGVKTVVISSTEIEGSDTLSLFGSSCRDGMKSRIRLNFPKLQAIFTGTGDLFAALLLAWMAKTDGNLKISCEKAINTMQSVLHRTMEHAESYLQQGQKKPDAYLMELKLIHSKTDIENPPSTFTATDL